MSATAAPIIVWFRSDLRLEDHPALAQAARDGAPVIPVFVYEGPNASRPLGGASKWWLHGSLGQLDAELRKCGSRLILRKGPAAEAILDLAEQSGAKAVYLSRAWEPGGRAQEQALRPSLSARGVVLREFVGNLLAAPGAVVSGEGSPYRVFTPFYKAFCRMGPPPSPIKAPRQLAAPDFWPESMAIESLNLRPSNPDWAGGLRAVWIPGEAAAQARLDSFLGAGLVRYPDLRDRPDADATSRLSPYLRFGEISARQIWHAVAAIAQQVNAGAEAYLRQLAWREFAAHLLFTFPELAEKPLRRPFEDFPWREDASSLARWQRGQTGYPLVDAGMRQLWQTGWLHNRARMIVASFLVKDLRIDWRAGEAWFWDTLVDADHANNAASWQWVAGCGTDAAPFFRIFNPVTQAKKFDPDGTYVHRWVPELAGLKGKELLAPWQTKKIETLNDQGPSYPAPVVDHAKARRRALAAFDSLKTQAPS